MREAFGDLWDFHRAGAWVCITTNGSVRQDGACVMGRGSALEAKKRFPHLPYALGDRLRRHGNHVFLWWSERMITFPVKHRWHEQADVGLIRRSCRELVALLDLEGIQGPVYLGRPGCGNGGLDWERQVRPAVAPLLDDRVVVITFAAWSAARCAGQAERGLL